jgi:hypothetical protein
LKAHQKDDADDGDHAAEDLAGGEMLAEDKHGEDGTPDDPGIADQGGFAGAEGWQGEVVGGGAQGAQDAAGDQFAGAEGTPKMHALLRHVDGHDH